MMGQINQEQINVDFFDEVKRFKKRKWTIKEKITFVQKNVKRNNVENWDRYRTLSTLY